MKEYKFLFKRIMLYIMRYGTDKNYYTLSKNIQIIFSCDGELVLMVMRLYYGDDVDELIEKELCDTLKWSPHQWVSDVTTIPSNLFNNYNRITNFTQVFNNIGGNMIGNLQIPDNIPTVNQNFNI